MNRFVLDVDRTLSCNAPDSRERSCVSRVKHRRVQREQVFGSKRLQAVLDSVPDVPVGGKVPSFVIATANIPLRRRKLRDRLFIPSADDLARRRVQFFSDGNSRLRRKLPMVDVDAESGRTTSTACAINLACVVQVNSYVAWNLHPRLRFEAASRVPSQLPSRTVAARTRVRRTRRPPGGRRIPTIIGSRDHSTEQLRDLAC